MTARDKSNIASLVLSFLLLVSGISICVLLYELVRQAAEKVLQDENIQNGLLSGVNSNMDAEQVTNRAFSIAGPFWLLGFGYIIPGVFGLIAGFSRKKCAYIVHLIFGIKGLLVMGIFFVIGVIGLGSLSVNNAMNCTDVTGTCKCRSSSYEEYTDIGMKSCDMMFTLYHLALAIVIMVVIGWILMLVETVLAGIKACQPQNGNPGTVIIRPPVQTTFVRLNEAHVDQPRFVHDQAILVHNY